MNLFKAMLLWNLVKFAPDTGGGGSGTGSEDPPAGDKGTKDDSKSKQKPGATDGDDEADDGDSDEGQLDVAKLPAAAQKLIKDLRKENGDSRKKLKDLSANHSKLKKGLVDAGIIEDDEADPQEKLKVVSSQNEAATFNNAILEAALEHGVSKPDLKYFRFLVNEAVGDLGEGDELAEEVIADLAKQAKRASNQKKSTSVEDGGTGGKPGASDSVTLDQFVKMNMGEKAALYAKTPDVYSAFIQEAKQKNILVK